MKKIDVVYRYVCPCHGCTWPEKSERFQAWVGARVVGYTGRSKKTLAIQTRSKREVNRGKSRQIAANRSKSRQIPF